MDAVIKRFEDYYGYRPTLVVTAPGRVNLIGEHTDYNQGLVMPAAVNLKATYAFGVNSSSNTFKIKALDLDEETIIDANTLTKAGPSWSHYHRGLLSVLKINHTLVGVDCVFTSDVPVGGGMSSSSAIECGYLAGLNHINQLGLDPWDMILLSQKSNHEFLGVKGGFLDQFSSFYGKEGHCMMLDCDTKIHEYLTLSGQGYQWVLINTNVKHDHVTSDYNLGPKECKEALQVIQKAHKEVRHLSDLTQESLTYAMHFLSEKLADRVAFVHNENQRVKDFRDALIVNDVYQMGTLLYQSHEGLRDQYHVSCKELDILVDLASKAGWYGSRMMGGGFGGCTINLVSDEDMHKIDSIADQYLKMTGITPSIISVLPSDGVTVIPIS